MTVRLRVPGAALDGAVTLKLSVTVCPGAMLTGAGLLTVQPDGALSVNCALGIE